MLQITPQAISLIKRHENFNPTPAPNYRGTYVIGFGHPATSLHHTLSPDQAHQLLLNDLNNLRLEVSRTLQLIQFNTFFGHALPGQQYNFNWLRNYTQVQHRFDALLSLRFSLTKAEFHASDLLNALFLGLPDDHLAHLFSQLIYIPTSLIPPLNTLTPNTTPTTTPNTLAPNTTPTSSPLAPTSTPTNAPILPNNPSPNDLILPTFSDPHFDLSDTSLFFPSPHLIARRIDEAELFFQTD